MHRKGEKDGKQTESLLLQNYPAAAPDGNSREEENGLPLGLPNNVVSLLSCEEEKEMRVGGERE